MTEDLNKIGPDTALEDMDVDHLEYEGPLTEINCTVELEEDVPVPYGIETTASGTCTGGLTVVHICFGEKDEDGHYKDGGFNVNMSVEDTKNLVADLQDLLDLIEEENRELEDL